MKSFRFGVPFAIREAVWAAMLFADAMKRNPDEYPSDEVSLWRLSLDSVDDSTVAILPVIYQEDYRRIKKLMEESISNAYSPETLSEIFAVAFQMLRDFSYAHPHKRLNDTQKLIMQALDGRALTADQLEVELNCSRPTVFGKNGKGGITELFQRGLVDNDPRLPGYFRPDKPPPE